MGAIQNIPPTGPQVSQYFTQVVPAGQTISIPYQGNSFYLVACSSVVQIRPRGGVFASYVQKTGLISVAQFPALEVRNPNPINGNNIFVSLWMGWGAYLDNRTEYDGYFVSSSAIQSLGTLSSTATIATIPDKSGTQVAVGSATNVVYLTRRMGVYLEVQGTTPSADSGTVGVYPDFGVVNNPFLIVTAGTNSFVTSPFSVIGRGNLFVQALAITSAVNYALTEIYESINPSYLTNPP